MRNYCGWLHIILLTRFLVNCHNIEVGEVELLAAVTRRIHRSNQLTGVLRTTL